MKRRLPAGLVFALVLSIASSASAHRLDEYLQATRIAVSTDRIELSMDLTPGVAVAQELLEVIDKDRDERVSKEEVAAYAQNVLKEIKIGLDDKALVLSGVDTAFPTLKEIKGGLGVIRIKAIALVNPLSVGTHTLQLTNTHLPKMSVYLVNALVPKSPAIKIAKQTRDEFQKTYRLDFEVTLPTQKR